MESLVFNYKYIEKDQVINKSCDIQDLTGDDLINMIDRQLELGNIPLIRLSSFDNQYIFPNRYDILVVTNDSNKEKIERIRNSCFHIQICNFIYMCSISSVEDIENNRIKIGCLATKINNKEI